MDLKGFLRDWNVESRISVMWAGAASIETSFCACMVPEVDIFRQTLVTNTAT